jgi:hypothetical protein
MSSEKADISKIMCSAPAFSSLLRCRATTRITAWSRARFPPAWLCRFIAMRKGRPFTSLEERGSLEHAWHWRCIRCAWRSQAPWRNASGASASLLLVVPMRLGRFLRAIGRPVPTVAQGAPQPADLQRCRDSACLRLLARQSRGQCSRRHICRLTGTALHVRRRESRRSCASPPCGTFRNEQHIDVDAVFRPRTAE